MGRILPEVGCQEPQTDSTILRFFRRFELNQILGVCGVRKEKGLSAWDTLLCLISIVFTGKSISTLEKEGNLPCGKSSLFRFLDNPRFHWRKVILYSTTTKYSEYHHLFKLCTKKYIPALPNNANH